MSVLGERAAVGAAAFSQLLDPRFENWLESCEGVTDDEGAVVMLSFGDTESVDQLFAASEPHAHSVVMSTLHNGHIALWVLGATMRADAPVGGHPIDADETMTIGELVDQLIALDGATEVVVNFRAGRRVLALAPA